MFVIDDLLAMLAAGSLAGAGAGAGAAAAAIPAGALTVGGLTAGTALPAAAGAGMGAALAPELATPLASLAATSAPLAPMFTAGEGLGAAGSFYAPGMAPALAQGLPETIAGLGAPAAAPGLGKAGLMRAAMGAKSMAGNQQQQSPPLQDAQPTFDPRSRMTLEMIRRKWLQRNDPRMYARLYGGQ